MMTVETHNESTGRVLVHTNKPNYIALLASQYTFKIKEWISPKYKVYTITLRKPK